MTLYYESASLIQLLDKSPDTSLKSLLFSKAKPESHLVRKSNSAQLYALVTEAWKWGPFLKDVIERAEPLHQEKKLTPELSLVLVHDLLLAKKGIAAPENHVLRQAVERHRTRLRAEFIKARIRTGCSSIEELKNYLEQQNKTAEESSEHTDPESRKWLHPRWLRINTVRVRPNLLDHDEFREWTRVDSLEEVMSTTFISTGDGSLTYCVDKHVPNLIALPPGTNLSNIPAYKRGDLISQDKASCFPAYLLSSRELFQGNILDACAAPGNKTSHIAAIISDQTRRDPWLELEARVLAVERDESRADVLRRMLGKAGADQVKVYGPQDFLKLDVNQEPWANVKAILLDPSCSGSGIIERNQSMAFSLPSLTATSSVNGGSKRNKNKKRKRQEDSASQEPLNNDQDEILTNEQDIELNEHNAAKLEARLKSLAALQTKMLIFAFSFPKALKITYSTCSIHDIENEGVVIAALASQTARSQGWRIMRPREQVEGMRAWKHRGRRAACELAVNAHGVTDLNTEEIAEACIRCEPLTEEGTQGFFVAGFVRPIPLEPYSGQLTSGEQWTETTMSVADAEEEQWTGFDD